MQPTSRHVPPNLGSAFNKRCFKAVLTGAHGRGISPRSAANYHDIVSHFRLKCIIRPLFISSFKDLRPDLQDAARPLKAASGRETDAGVGAYH